MTVVLTYSRSLLIAVYTHLLLLSEAQGAQVLWRWVNVFWCAVVPLSLSLSVWSE